MGDKKWPVKIPDFDLNGKVAIVTGGTKGIGYAIAMVLAHAGAKVVISSRHQDECDKVAEEIRSLGGRAIGMRCDVSDLQQIKHLMSETMEQFGCINILVNNAGVAVTKSIIDTTEEDYDKVFDTNLKSLYFTSAEAVKYMIEAGCEGRIIHIASIGGLKGTKNIATYSASKAAVLNLTKTMALEWARYGITVNAICPGYVKTAINEKEFEDEKFLQYTLKQIPQRRLGTADEVAAIALFLASDYSGMMTGGYLLADMGSVAG